MLFGEDFCVTRATTSINTSAEILTLAEIHADDLPFDFVNKKLFLYALAGQESAFGRMNLMRYEPNYGPGGLYYQKSKELKQAYFDYGGAPVCCSYGPWQIMYSTAVQYGYKGHPLSLYNGYVSIPFVCAKLQADWDRGAKTLEQILSAYNTGSFKNPANFPSKYIMGFKSIYQSILNLA